MPLTLLRGWTKYGNSTRFRTSVIKDLERDMMVYVDNAGNATLLRPGEKRAQQLMLAAAAA